MSWVIQGRRVLDKLCRVVKKKERKLHFIDDDHLWHTKAARPLCWLLGWIDDQRPGHGDSSIAVRHLCSGRCDRSWGGWRRPPGPQSPPLQSQHISWWSCWTLPSTFTKNLKLWAYWRAWFVEHFLVLTFDNQLYCNHTGHCELSISTFQALEPVSFRAQQWSRRALPTHACPRSPDSPPRFLRGRGRWRSSALSWRRCSSGKGENHLGFWAGSKPTSSGTHSPRSSLRWRRSERCFCGRSRTTRTTWTTRQRARQNHWSPAPQPQPVPSRNLLQQKRRGEPTN